MNRAETDLIYHEIFDDRIYCLGGLTISDGDVVVDIGANIGLFLLFATREAKDLRVLSFEPIPDTFDVLRRNAAELESRVELFNEGVSKEKGSATFRHLPRFSCSSSMKPDDSDEQKQRAEDFTLNAFEKLDNRFFASAIGVLPKAGKRILARAVNRYHQKAVDVTCKLTSVSDIIRDNQLAKIDYLKLDAEGAELDVLAGIEEQHWDLISQFAVETHHGGETLRKVVKILEQHGFTTTTDFSPSSPTDGMVYAHRQS
jgi:FkbM family methyltransferase